MMNDLPVAERSRSPDTRVASLPWSCCTWRSASRPGGTTVALAIRHPPHSRRDRRPWPLTHLTSLPLLWDNRPGIWKRAERPRTFAYQLSVYGKCCDAGVTTIPIHPLPKREQLVHCSSARSYHSPSRIGISFSSDWPHWLDIPGSILVRSE